MITPQVISRQTGITKPHTLPERAALSAQKRVHSGNPATCAAAEDFALATTLARNTAIPHVYAANRAVEIGMTMNP